MKFKIQQKVFHNALTKSKRAISTSNTMPILSGVLLEADEESNLILTATDLEIGIVLKLGADVEKPGKIVIPGDELSSIIRELPEGILEFSVDQSEYSAEIITESSEFLLRGFKPEEFPELPEVDITTSFSLEADRFKDMVDKVKFSCSKKASEPGLTGALLTADTDSITMVATNTFRMAYYKREMELPDVEEKSRAIIPQNTLSEVSRLIDDEDDEIYVEMGSNHCRFSCGDVIITSRLIDGKFPNYKQVMPDDYSAEVNISRRGLRQAVKRVSTIARLDSNVIELDFDEDLLTIESSASEKGHGKEEVRINFTGQPQQSIKIDASYMMDGLKVLDEESVRLELIGKINPITMKNPGSDEYIYLIMPIRPDSNE